MDKDRTIHHSVNCFACGYDLRGLQPSGLCPECGLRVGFTLEQRYTERYFERFYAERDESAKRYSEFLARGEERQKREYARREENMKRNSACLDRAEQQQERINRILDRFEAIQARAEALLDRYEQM